MSQICTKCKEVKTDDSFQKDSSRICGINTRCKACVSKRRQSPKYRNYDLEYNRTYAKKNAEFIKKRTRKNNIRKLYGLTQEEFTKMSSAQDDKCAICFIHVSETKYSNLCIDHDHSTGDVRGLLCDTCNRAIGLLKDSADVLISAAQYVTKFRIAG